ncbi:MAG: hypothetical protein HC908_08925 [Calothrix sp. SM1_7_51]|nr:hypothetical protein [Calothrix sp. SM1_7_51]
MHLEQKISQSLYQAVREKYECGLYRDAILAATFQLQESIREKANLATEQIPANPLDSISHLFGVPKPLIQVNNMNSVAEVYEQMGFEQMLLGILQGVQYSRIHAECFDNDKTANAIIVFVDYLITRIQNSQTAHLQKVSENQQCA